MHLGREAYYNNNKQRLNNNNKEKSSSVKPLRILEIIEEQGLVSDLAFNMKIDVMEIRLMDMGRGEERVTCMERVTWKFTLPYVK